MTLGRRALQALASVLLVAFVAVIVLFMLWPPPDDASLKTTVAKEVARAAVQLLGLSLLGGLVSQLVRDARERKDFALRLRNAYGKAKACRRRLRRLSGPDRMKELELLDGVQLEFEALKDEAEWTYGKDSSVHRSLTLIETYLGAVVDGGFSNEVASERKRRALEDFLADYSSTSRFASDLKEAYRSCRKALR